MPLNIYTGNRMETLVDALACVVEKPLSSPFRKEMIVVQSRGMERWLAMELAKRLGVWANCEYPFPNEIVWRLFRDNLEDIPEDSPFSPEAMTWRIMGMLPGLLDNESFSPLKGYLADDTRGVKLLQLAERIADTYDQYTIFRPEMLLEWEDGAKGGWQGVLWRGLAAAGGGRHRTRLKEEFLHLACGGKGGMLKMPERISLFGISYLPRYHMDILAAASARADVNLFLMSPTGEYWGDIATAKAISRMSPAERELRIEGNPLLASLGRMGRDFSETVIETAESAVTVEDRYLGPDEGTLLASIQSDILNLRGTGRYAGPLPIDTGDCSVQIHSCHGPMREIEVLHDNLLALLENMPGLEPRDILVMTPDIEGYAPFIAAVFGGVQDPARWIPFSIADRSLTGEGVITSTFLKLLSLPGGRLTVTQVLDIMESPPVMARFGFDDRQMALVRSWLEETRVCWGMDEGDRKRAGLPAYRENSWRAALDRLFLGYAVTGGDGRLFNDKLPCDDVEGTNAGTLGLLAEFMERLNSLSRALDGDRGLGSWRNDLLSMIDGVMAAGDESAYELAQVTAVVEELGGMEKLAGFSSTVGLGAIRAWLQGKLEKKGKGQGFMTGGVTFCAMLPMRSIPFRVIGLIGMNDGAFPRQNRPPGFDLIFRHPRRGDRSLRDEDRYLFLEAILSARDCLYISYTGQSIRDNSEIPPSVLVSEFIDAVARGRNLGAADATERLVVRHRLQAFSSAYFKEGSGLFSYSAENLAALRERRDARWTQPEFLSEPLPLPDTDWREVQLAELLRFFANPARFFLWKRLKIRVGDAAAELSEREPFSLGGLDAYSLRQELLETVLRDEDPMALYPEVRGRGLLPPALHGRELFGRAVEEVAAFAAGVREKFEGCVPLEPLEFRLGAGEFILCGRLEGIWPARMIRYRHAGMKGRDQLAVWIEHLVLNGVAGCGYPRESVLIMIGGTRVYRPVNDPIPLLADILDLYREGLVRPLRFFPESAMEYAGKGEWRLDRARKRWEGDEYHRGEGEEPAYRLCFGGEDELNEEFERIARTLLGPMVHHQT